VVDVPGAARLVLVEGVVHLDEGRAVFDAMVEGLVSPAAEPETERGDDPGPGAAVATVRRVRG
jgi:hypothetical protein